MVVNLAVNRRALLASVFAAVASVYAPALLKREDARYFGAKHRVAGKLAWETGCLEIQEVSGGGIGGAGGEFVTYRYEDIGSGRKYATISDWLAATKADPTLPRVGRLEE